MDLSPDAVDGIVFWSKYPAPMLDRLHLLRDYTFYFLYTLNAYGEPVEARVPPSDECVETFRRLSGLIGPDRVVWRYDPVILSENLSVARHIAHFGELASQLRGLTRECTISFVDPYRQNSRAMKSLGLRPPADSEISEIARGLAAIGREYGLALKTCAEPADLAGLGIGRARCVDNEKIAALSDRPVRFAKDRCQRPACGCTQSVDIGRYGTCGYGCVYCYANGR